MDEYFTYTWYTVNAWKRVSQFVLGGSLGRTEATGRGVMVTTLAAMGKLKINPYNASCAVQGFVMWYVAARLLKNVFEDRCDQRSVRSLL